MATDDSVENIINKPLDNTGGALKFSTDRQIKIWQALAKLHPVFGPRIASIYEGIIIALNSENPEKISIVSHLTRELSTILPIYVSGLPVKQIRITDEQIRKDLNVVLGMLGNDNDSDGKVKEIVENILAQIPEQSSQRDQLKRVVDSHPLLGSRASYLNDEFIKQWMRIHRYFVKSCHYHEIKNRKKDSMPNAQLLANWNTFEILIYRVLVKEPFFNPINEIDRLLKIDIPTEKDADDLMAHMVESEHRRYFFDKCNNPNWLELLNKRNAFSSPQEPRKIDGYVQFIPWPESKYLAKVADSRPKEVYEIIKNLTSENQTVLYDFLKSALVSPPDIAANYANLIIKKKWLLGPYNMSLPSEVADLMQKLAKEGKYKESLGLVNELLALRAFTPPHHLDDSGAPSSLFRPDAKPYFDEWQFGEIVKNKTDALAESKPVELFDTYVQKLKDAIVIEDRENTPGKLYEYSHIWRPNLQKARNLTEDAKNILLDGLIALIERYQKDSAILKKFSIILTRQTFALFKRLEMFMYRYSPDNFIAEADSILRKKEVVIAYNLRREYLPLLGDMYLKISEGARVDILKTIEEGPDFTKHEDYTDEQFNRICADWKALYLAPIKDHLPKDQADEYSAIVSKYGESVDHDGEIITWDGGKSPISSEDLSVMDAEKVLQYLADYAVPDDPFARHSSGGLGMVFAGLVEGDPEKFVTVSSLFFEKKIRPIFFYHLTQGLRQALQKEKVFDWNPVIDIYYRLIVGNQYISDPANSDEQDWNSVQRATADFLGLALGRLNNPIPLLLKDKIWEIILNLSEDPEPTPADEHREGDASLDPMTLAINTTRGEAMQALINYGLWIARGLEDKTVEVKIPAEMVEILDKHLDIDKDPSLAIRSVYGQRVPNLFYLNEPWLKENKEKIFSKDNPEHLLAAWEGYLTNNVIREIFTLLKQEYYDFIPHIGSIEKIGYRGAELEQRFPQHVMIVFANEFEHDDFVHHFFDAAPPKARAEAINFAGRVILRDLSGSKDPKETKKRLGQLWIKRISLPLKDISKEELKEFGWWFKVSPFGRKETLDQTIKTLELIKGIIDVPYEIAEELKSYTIEFPVESIQILNLLVRAERETYEHLYKKDEYREVIRLVKSTENEDAKAIADEIINHLGSIGLIEDFRDLL